MVALQKPTAGVIAGEAMADHPLAAWWPGRYSSLPASLLSVLSLLTYITCCFFIVFLICQGGSGVGRGNFLEIGPLDVDLNPRNSTWLQKADLIFVVSLGDYSFRLTISQFLLHFYHIHDHI